MKSPLFHITSTSTAVSIKAITILLVAVAVFQQDLTVIFGDALQSETMSYILAIPFIFAYLIYRKRKMLRAVVTLDSQSQPKEIKHLPTIAGILLSLLAMLLYWYGSYTFTPLEYHIFAIPVFVAGLILILFNLQTLRQLAFPIAFLILLMPPPSLILYGLGATLSVISAEASNTILTAMGINSTLSSEYGNPIIQVTRSNGAIIPFTVDVACSGVYSLMGFVIFAAFIVYIIRDKLWKRAAIFPIGLSLVYLLNITRITIILLIGYEYGEEAALQIFHLLGGWVLIFLGTILLLTVTEKMLNTRMFLKKIAITQCKHPSKLSINPQNFCSSCGRLLRCPEAQLKKQEVAKIIVIAIAVAMVLSLQAPVFTLTKGPAEIIFQTPMGEQTTTQILPQIQGYKLEFAYRDRDFEKLTEQDASLIYAYVPNDRTKEYMWITIEIASARDSLHRWEICLITWPQTHGYQPNVVQLDLRDTHILENPPIVARYFAFKYAKTNQTQVVLYWYEKSVFQTNSTSQQKYVKISVIAYNSPENITETEAQLATIAKAIAQYWQPTKTWTLAALLISQNGDKLAAATIGLLITVVAFYALERRNERKTNTYSYQKLSKSAKRLTDIIHETEKATTPELNAIATQYHSITKETINKEELFQELVELEKTGMIRSNITNQYDEPILIWKTQINFKKTLKIQ